jgi:hypothetical protein
MGGHERTSLRRLTVLLSLGICLAARCAAAQTPTATPVDVVLDRATAYVRNYERDLAALVAEEVLTQQASDGRTSSTARTTRADLLLVRAPGRDSWLPFRDVFELNGRAVREHDERLRKLLLDSPSTALDSAARIASESSRYNIGSVIRTIDVPTFALMLLRPDYRRRFTFVRRGQDTIDAVSAWRIDFTEHARPAIVRTLRNSDVMLEGSYWIEPESGRVVKTLVKTEGTPDPGIRIPQPNRIPLMWVMVTFAENPDLGLWVPDHMNEVAVSMDRSSVTVTATYSNFRRFDVSTTQTFKPPNP